jgi:uncharacterized surface protein with fasciclin (FAS1) repeats
MKRLTTLASKCKNAFMLVAVCAMVLTACKKEQSSINTAPPEVNNETSAVAAARQAEQTGQLEAQKEGDVVAAGEASPNEMRSPKNIVERLVGNSNFTALVAAAIKTDLAGALSNPSASLTVFAPTNHAFAGLPAPFNNAANIAGITDAAQIAFLKSVLLYHVLGTEVFSHQIANGRSSAVTLKGAGTANDNTIYFSNKFGLIRINGQTNVIRADRDASNGVIHWIDKVLLFPTTTIAGVATSNPAFSSLVAALVKTNLVGVFTGSGDFTVFAPTNNAFAALPAPFNNAANIGAITNTTQINALSNILRYHVVGSRYFAWDFGILSRITTLADAPNNKVTTILGYNNGFVKGDNNPTFSFANPADILTTNGVVHVIDRVLLPK